VNLKSKVLLLALLLVPCSQIFSDDLADFDVDEQGLPLDEATRSRHVKKWLRIRNNLTVGGNETVGGSLMVDGGLTTNSITISPAVAVGTPGVPGVGGMLAWGEVSSTAVITAVTGPLAMNNVGSSFFGIIPAATSVGATSGLTLTNAGVYIFQYSASNTGPAATTINLISSLGTSPIPFSQFTAPANATGGEASGFVIVAMPAGAFVQLNAVTAVTDATTGAFINAKLSAMRIS
jgi:hypothetical protein